MKKIIIHDLREDNYLFILADLTAIMKTLGQSGSWNLSQHPSLPSCCSELLKDTQNDEICSYGNGGGL